MQYPYTIMHKQHIGFRAKGTDSRGEDILYPDGSYDQAGMFLFCGTCKQIMSQISIAAGEWKVVFSLR